MAELDSMRRMWDALHHAGCEPHGDTYKFRARCPVHGGTNTDALQVYEGADRSCVFGCYAHGCDKRQILDAVGLRWRDMFPTGHRNGRRETPRRPVEPRPLSAGAAFLDTLLQAGFPWRAMVVLPCCPYCETRVAWCGCMRAAGLTWSARTSACLARFGVRWRRALR
jgi:hypothetical protein